MNLQSGLMLDWLQRMEAEGNCEMFYRVSWRDLGQCGILSEYIQTFVGLQTKLSQLKNDGMQDIKVWVEMEVIDKSLWV